MSDFEAFDLDKVTRRAWSQFQARLAVHLAAMDEGDSLVLELDASDDDDEVAPYIQFLADEDSDVLVEVSSNHHLTGVHRLGPDQEAAITELGFNPPAEQDDADESETTLNFRALALHKDTARLAVVAVKVLRDVFRIPHPAFLKAPGLNQDAQSAEGRVDLADEMQLVVPQNHAHLQALVDDALLPLFDDVPQHDDDGDIPVVNGTTLLFVRVAGDEPRIELFAEIVRNIKDLDRARFEVGVLNRDSRLTKYVLLGDRVLASLSLIAFPFVPQHLRTAIGWFSKETDGVDDDLAFRVAGQRFVDTLESNADDETPAPVKSSEDDDDEDDDDDEPLHPAMMTLLQLDAESPGSVDPEQAASICDNDRSLILKLITFNEEQEIAWRQARDEALLEGDDDEEAKVCDHEMQHAERHATLLRRALRHVVQLERSQTSAKGREQG